MTQLQEKNAVMAYKFGMPLTFLCKTYKATHSEMIKMLHRELIESKKENK